MISHLITRLLSNSKNLTKAYSTIHTKMPPQSQNFNLASKDLSREFMTVFPDLVLDLTDAGRQTDISEVRKRFAKVLHYNVPNGKKTRGLAAVSAYQILEKPENLSAENFRLALIAGWCVEMLQGHFLMIDDIMDGSESRRGQPCWYRQPDIGLAGINDANMIRSGLLFVLRRHLSEHPCYLRILELFNDVTLKTEMGQSWEMMTGRLTNGKLNLDTFTMNKYESIVTYKTAYCTCYLPVGLAMYLANITDAEQHRQTETILLEMGRYFQIQDDYLDCYGDPEVTGKIGSDIREGKCSWLAVVALQRATPSQRKIMEQYYGVHDEEAVKRIKNLYEELGIQNIYSIYEEEIYNKFTTHIRQISGGPFQEFLLKWLEKFYKRRS